MESENLLSDILSRALQGESCSVDDALRLNEICSADELCDAADKVRRHWNGDTIDMCSIVNARSGRCSEDCKWCAQSRFYHTGCEEYDIVPEHDVMKAAAMNCSKGVKRFSLVTSGRKVGPGDIDRFCDMFRRVNRETSLSLCASMGLLTKAELQKLYDAGVRRYHCNLESSPDHFTTLCTTHSYEDKLATIRAAREVGMEVCSGGIIGMGENMRQRLELAHQSVMAGACSIPVNLLNPIPGTPLEGTPLISEEEIIRTIALYRLIAPKSVIRFAGGRLRLSDKATRRILRGGVNGALVGDMLTTVGNNIDQDRALFTEIGYKLHQPE